MSGLRIAALFGFYTQILGFCGPRGNLISKALSDFLFGKKISRRRIRKILKGFKGAYFYYKLIAECNNIKDHFNERVVKAYWIGNDLLEKVKITDLRQMIVKDFSRPGLLPKEIALKKAEEIPENSKPHHSFHVLIVGPIMRRIVLEGKLFDLCRVSWGEVKSIENSKVVVKYQPLTGAKKLRLGKSIEKEISWDKTLIPKVKISDWVSIHWNNLVEVLNKEDLQNLKKYTKNTLKATIKIL